MKKEQTMTEEMMRTKRETFFNLVVNGVQRGERAMIRFPQPNYVISKVAEESGEVVKAAIHCAEGRETHCNVAREMEDCIAMLFRLWVEGDQVHGLQSIHDGIEFEL